MNTEPQYQAWTCYNPQDDGVVTAKLNEMSLKGYRLVMTAVLREGGPYSFDHKGMAYGPIVQYIFLDSHVDSGR